MTFDKGPLYNVIYVARRLVSFVAFGQLTSLVWTTLDYRQALTIAGSYFVVEPCLLMSAHQQFRLVSGEGSVS